MSDTNGGEIFRLIPKVMASVGAIGKGRRNQQQNYAFRGIDDIYNAVHSALVEYGVFIVPEVIGREREERQTKNGGLLIYTTLTVRHTFYAPDGSNVQAVTVGEAMDSGDKSSNKALSAAMKYAVIETFAIPTEGDNDTENQTPEPAPRQQVPAQSQADRNAAFVDAVDAAYAARGFEPTAAAYAQRKVLADRGITDLMSMDEAKRHAYIKAIRDGQFDDLKAEHPLAEKPAEPTPPAPTQRQTRRTTTKAA